MARLKLSIVPGSGARFGPGEAALLESIRDTESISAAARGMSMSCKRASLLIDSLPAHRLPAQVPVGGRRLDPRPLRTVQRYRPPANGPPPPLVWRAAHHAGSGSGPDRRRSASNRRSGSLTTCTHSAAVAVVACGGLCRRTANLARARP